MIWPYDYKIIFKKLNSRIIYNYIGPYDWNDSIVRIEERKIIINREENFFKTLETSILNNGIINPILVNKGKYPFDTNGLPIKDYICWQFGGSRLYIAQKYNLDIPVIINDFNLDECGEILIHGYDILSKFSNNNFDLKYSKDGLIINERR